MLKKKSKVIQVYLCVCIYIYIHKHTHMYVCVYLCCVHTTIWPSLNPAIFGKVCTRTKFRTTQHRKGLCWIYDNCAFTCIICVQVTVIKFHSEIVSAQTSKYNSYIVVHLSSTRLEFEAQKLEYVGIGYVLSLEFV